MSLGRVLALAPLQVVQALVGLGAIAAFTRLMSAEEFGRYALALSASMLAHTLLFTWAEAAAFRFFAAARAEKRLADHFATLLALALGLGALVLTAAIAVLALAGVQQDITALAAFAVGAAVFRLLTRITRESDRAALEIGRYATLETAYLAIGFAAGVALLTTSDLGAAAPFAGLLLAGALVLLIDGPRLLARAKGGAMSVARAARYASYGGPLALALALDLGVQTAARFILAHQAGVSELGAYAAAFGLARPLDLIFIAAGAVLSPLLVAAYTDKGAGGVHAPAARGFAILVATAIPAAIGLALIATPLSTLLVGEALSATAARASPWLALAGLATGFNLYYWSEAFQLTRRTWLRAGLMLAPGFVQLVLTIVLAPAHGAVGAGAAAAMGACVGTGLLALVGRTFLPLPAPSTIVLKVAAATGFMALIVSALPPASGVMALLAPAAIGALAYALGALALNIGGIRDIAAASFRWPTSVERTHAS